MSVLNSLSALIRALALYCRDSGQVPLSMCLFSDFMAASAWKILLSADSRVLGRSGGVFLAVGSPGG